MQQPLPCHFFCPAHSWGSEIAWFRFSNVLLPSAYAPCRRNTTQLLLFWGFFSSFRIVMIMHTIYTMQRIIKYMAEFGGTFLMGPLKSKTYLTIAFLEMVRKIQLLRTSLNLDWKVIFCNLPANFQLNIFIFEVKTSLQTFLQSLKQNDNKSARLGTTPDYVAFLYMSLARAWDHCTVPWDI